MEELDNIIKCVCISDTHAFTNFEVPKGDILIHAGDFTNIGKKADIEKFVNHLNTLDFKYKVVIAGNHDLTFDELEYENLMKDFHYNTNPKELLTPTKSKELLKDFIYLEDSGINILGYNFWGSPITPTFYDWAFNKERGEKIKAYWDKIPSETEILITHGPPYGILDEVKNGNRIIHSGCEELMKKVEEIKPLYHIFGHIHEGYGIKTVKETTFINASTCTLRYLPINKPIVFYLDKK